MAYSRKRKATKRPLKRKAYKRSKDKWTTLKAMVNSTVQRTVNRNLETKQSNFSSTDGVEIFHNNFITPDGSLLYTTQGTADPMSNDAGGRIGDEIMLRGISLKFMLELNERYSDVTFRILVVKCAKGDQPTRATLFTGLSGNKMLDTLNKERYTVIAQKWCKLKAPNAGTWGGEHTAPSPEVSGTKRQTEVDRAISRATKIVKLWIPGTKIVRSGKVQYENGSVQPKFFDYQVLVYAYSNYSTSQDLYYVGRLNDYVKQIFYKDG